MTFVRNSTNISVRTEDTNMYNSKNGDNILIIANDEASTVNIKSKITENVKVTSIPTSKIESIGEKFSCTCVIRKYVCLYLRNVKFFRFEIII